MQNILMIRMIQVSLVKQLSMNMELFSFKIWWKAVEDSKCFEVNKILLCCTQKKNKKIHMLRKHGIEGEISTDTPVTNALYEKLPNFLL